MNCAVNTKHGRAVKGDLCADCSARSERMYGTNNATETTMQTTKATTTKPATTTTAAKPPTGPGAKPADGTGPKPPTAAAKPASVAAAPQQAASTDGAGPTTGLAQSTAAKKQSYQARLAKLSPAKRAAVKVANSLARWSTIEDTVEGWPNEAPALSKAVKGALEKLNKFLQELPADFKGPKRPAGSGGPSLEEGDKVRITDKAKEKYDGILDAKEFVNLLVVKVVGNRIVCKTVSGEKVILPRGHVSPEDVEDDEDEEGDDE